MTKLMYSEYQLLRGLPSVIMVMLTLLFCPSLLGQINIDDNVNLEDAVRKLMGDGVIVSNITSKCAFPDGSDSPLGTFEDIVGVLDMDEGLVLTSGSVQNLKGPNDASQASQGNNHSIVDNDLQTLVNDLGAGSYNDACVVEFDLVTATNLLRFRYLFGSEEYPEYVSAGYYDVFGFFISGPGIVGTKNLAVVPGTNIPISVGTINANTNSQYYKSNGTGDSPAFNPYLQYDGITRVITAEAEVVPCETYHFKIAIADVNDGIVDSGVFVETGSFESNIEPGIEVVVDFPEFKNVIEECNDGHVIITRQGYDTTIMDQPVSFGYSVLGTATSGDDYDPLSGTLVIPPFEMSASIDIHAFRDMMDEDLESVDIVLHNKCDNFPDLATVTVLIQDSIEFDLKDEGICKGDSVWKGSELMETDSVIWDPENWSSCEVCDSTQLYPLTSDTMQFSYVHLPSGCPTSNEFVVEVKNPIAGFDFETKEDYTTLDVFFTNTSTGAKDFEWDFGDEAESDEEDPLHQFEFENDGKERQYKVTMWAMSQDPNCRDSIDTTIVIRNSLFIPNVITPNLDGKNEQLTIDGIVEGIWEFAVYNRWGDNVYRSAGYANDWTGQDLADGTYYFELVNPPGDRIFKGWLEIIR